MRNLTGAHTDIVQNNVIFYLFFAIYYQFYVIFSVFTVFLAVFAVFWPYSVPVLNFIIY